MVSETTNESLLTSFTTVTVPSPFELYAHFRAGSNAAPSHFSPIGKVVITFPVSESTTTISLLAQTLNKRWVSLSKAKPVGSDPGAIDHTFSTLNVVALITAI